MKNNRYPTEGRCSIVKYGEKTFEGEGLVKIPWDSSCMTGPIDGNY